MLIRCGRCKALYSLQDGVAQGGGVLRVECGRCRQTFTAEPPKPVEPPPPPFQRPHPNVLEKRVGRAEPRLEDALLEVTSRRKRTLLICLLLLVVVAGAFAARAAFTGVPRAVREKVARGEERLVRDDLVSATALFTEAAHEAPGNAGPEGQRGFALLLQSAAHHDLARRLSGPAADAESLAATRLLQEGVAAAKAALDDDGEDPWGLRAMALYCALSEAPERGRLYVGAAAAKSPSSPWDPLIRALLGDEPAAQLQLALQRQPALVRARVELAALAIDQQQPGAARDQLAAVLREHPQHDRAKRLLAFLPAAP